MEHIYLYMYRFICTYICLYLYLDLYTLDRYIENGVSRVKVSAPPAVASPVTPVPSWAISAQCCPTVDRAFDSASRSAVPGAS